MIDLSNVPEFYHGYFNQVGDQEPRHLMKQHLADNEAFFLNLPAEKWDYAYDEGKWTIKEVLGHIVDAERVFQYRALRFSRNDKTELPGFDQDAYVAAGNTRHRSIESMIKEYVAVRHSSLALFEGLSPEELTRTGKANGYLFETGWMAYLITGHEMHHMQVLRERYGV